MIQISIRENVTPELRRIAASIGPSRLGSVAGRAVVNTVRAHLFARNASHPNKLGGTRQNFWAAAARSTHMRSESWGAMVSINALGFRLQYQGGTVRPTTRKFLTIPAKAEAYGKRAGEFDDLEFTIIPGKGPALVAARRSEIRIRKVKGGFKVVHTGSTLGNDVFYWLARSVRIPAHPDALPPEAKMAEAAQGAVGSFLMRQADRKSNPNPEAA